MRKRREDCCWVCKALCEIAMVISTRRNRSYLLGITLNIPVRGVIAAVVDFKRETAGPAHNAGGLPSADQFIGQAFGATQKSLSGPKRQIPYEVRIQLVAHIIVGWPIELVGHPCIHD